jgi:uncharacterized protein YciI
MKLLRFPHLLSLLLLLGTLAIPGALSAAEGTPATPPPAAKRAALKHFLIVLRLIPRLHDDKAWTDADKAAIGAHFQRLKSATDAGQVVMAGRTPEPGDQTMGLIVFSAADVTAAREFMNSDPCVAAGIMTAELHPFDIALLRKS